MDAMRSFCKRGQTTYLEDDEYLELRIPPYILKIPLHRDVVVAFTDRDLPPTD